MRFKPSFNTGTLKLISRHALPRELQIGEELSLMYRRKTFNGLNFYNYKFINHQIHAIPAIQLHALIYDWKRDLTAELCVRLREFVTQTLFVCRLQQTRAQCAMHVYRVSNHALRDLVGSLRLCVSAVHYSLTGRRLPIQHLLQNVVLPQAVGFGVEVQENAVAKNGDEQRADVFVGDVVTALLQGASLSGQDQELRRAHTGAVVHILFDEIGGGFVTAARGPHQVNGVPRDRFADGHHADKLLEFQNLSGVGHRVGLRHVRGGGQIDHLHLFLRRQIIEHRVEQEPVELRFGQRVGAFQLDGVLCGQHEERRRQLVVIAANGAGHLLHGFEQRRLRLGGRAVDFVGKQHVGENRALHERPRAVSGGSVLFNDVGAGNVRRHQVGGELDALEY